MQIHFNTFKTYSNSYSQANKQQQNKNIGFTSGYGAEDWEPIDNPNLPINSNAERWKNLAKALKMMTIDQYKYVHDIHPKPPKPLFTPEEIKKYQDSFYDDVEPVDLTDNPYNLNDEDFADWKPPVNEKPEKTVEYSDTLDEFED